jgi:hypothetical protein
MDLNLHIKRGILLSGRTSLDQLAELKIAQKNKLPVSVWLLDDGPDVSTPVQVIPLPEPYTDIVLSSRPNDDLDENELLFFLSDFTEVGTGASLHYEGTLNTNTAGVTALFTPGTPLQARTKYGCLLDIDFLVNGDPDDGRETVLKQRDYQQYRAIWQGTEGVPTDGNPTYPLPSVILKTSDLATAEIEVGDAFVDFDITAAALEAVPDTLLSLGVTKPSAGAANIGILSLLAVDAQTLRAYLTAAPTETGYVATVLFKE